MDDVQRTGLTYGGGMSAVTRGNSRPDAPPSELPTALSTPMPSVLPVGMPAMLIALVQVAGTSLAGVHQASLNFRPLDLGGYLLLILGPMLLLWRRRNPPLVLVAVLAVTVTYSLLDYPHGPIYLALIAAFAQAVVAGHRVVAYLTLVVGYLSLTLLTAAATGRDRPGLPFLGGVAAWLLVLLVGSELFRIRRAYRAERVRRRREAEATREEEARRRASEERLEIARELHDVMAHSISLINVQAGVALELMDRRPEQARQALTAIKAASKEALLEVQAVLSALRRTGEAAPTAALPSSVLSSSVLSSSVLSSPGLSGLDRLVARARLSGVDVHTRTDGEVMPLSTGLDQAAGRIVQEALTNVARHARSAGTAPVEARLKISYRTRDLAEVSEAELVIVVDNDGISKSAKLPELAEVELAEVELAEVELAKAGSVEAEVAKISGFKDDSDAAIDSGGVEMRSGGRGIAGMRERAQAYGGTVIAGPRNGGFRVEARLPIGAVGAVPTGDPDAKGDPEPEDVITT